MAMIPLVEYAAMHGRAAVSVRQMAQRGGLRTARKQGRDWMIDEHEPYPDRRRRMAETLTREGMDTLDADERRQELRVERIRQYSRVGSLGGTFTACLRRIPAGLLDTLTPEQAGRVVDLVHDTYQAGRRDPDMEWLEADGE